MSDEYAMPSWKSLASSASRSIKSYVSQRDFKRPFPASRDVGSGEGSDGGSRIQTWSQWAGQKLRQVQGEGTSVERLMLFPGWATRRFYDPLKSTADDAPFEVELFISGFASRSSGPGFNSRSAKAFLKIATSFAALPKLATQSGTGVNDTCLQQGSMGRSTEDLLKDVRLPALPDEMDENAEIQALESKLRDLDMETASTVSGLTSETNSVASSYTSCNSSIQSAASSTPESPFTNGRTFPLPSDVQKWSTNLETRLHPFWSSALSGRTVRVSIFVKDPSLYKSDEVASSLKEDTHRPLIRRDVVTAADGAFQVKFHVAWETLCLHPEGLQIAFGDRQLEHNFFVIAELLPPPSPRTPNVTPYQQPRHLLPTPTTTYSIAIPLTYSPIRVISDIDDTVKLASVLSGARTVFRNVFVKDLGDSVIPGMAEWYMKMWRRGVRFHYVSNAPFELLPVINQFFQLSHLPPGSIKLRSYGGRSLFTGLLSAPAARKRAGVLAILDSFPDSRFMAVGDSGEQDLELYANLAKERPTQILAIFIRDVTADSDTQPLDDPTGVRVLTVDTEPRSGPIPIAPAMSRRSSSRKNTIRGPPARSLTELKSAPRHAVRKPKRMHSDTELPSAPEENSDGYFTSASLATASVTEEPDELSSESSPIGTIEQDKYDAYSSARPYISEAERRQHDLQMRVWRARLEVPRQIPLRVFRKADECVEAMTILDGLRV